MPDTLPPAISKSWPLSYWMPGKPGALADFQSSSQLPSEADIVIIGSGFSGASVAYHLLNESKAPLRVVMLEARQACSGASGRNGGHLQPSFFPGPPYGESQVKRGDFERQNYQALQKLISENGITSANTTFTGKSGEESEGWLVYPTRVEFESARAQLSKLIEAGGDSTGLRVYSGTEARQRTGLENIAGAISHTATPINPYELVSWLLAQSLTKGLYLYTNTPVESVVKTPAETIRSQTHTETYNVTTNKGVIKTAKVIFATNAYSGHLLGSKRQQLDVKPRSHIYPVRGQVAAFKVPKSVSKIAEMLPGKQHDHINLNWDQEYCVVLPNADDKYVDFVYGGARRYGAGLQVGLVDDNTVSKDVSSSLDDFFQFRLGIPLASSNSNSSNQEDVGGISESGFLNYKQQASSDTSDVAVKKSEWTGIMGFTEDHNPCVGALNSDESLLVIAGFGGHGMPRIYLSAKALVDRYLSPSGNSAAWPEWFPDEYKN